MNISSNKEVMVTIMLNEREAKLLTCLLGAMSPTEAEETIQRGIHFSEWIGKLERREVVEFTGIMYDTLYEQF